MFASRLSLLFSCFKTTVASLLVLCLVASLCPFYAIASEESISKEEASTSAESSHVLSDECVLSANGAYMVVGYKYQLKVLLERDNDGNSPKIENYKDNLTVSSDNKSVEFTEFTENAISKSANYTCYVKSSAVCEFTLTVTLKAYGNNEASSYSTSCVVYGQEFEVGNYSYFETPVSGSSDSNQREARFRGLSKKYINEIADSKYEDGSQTLSVPENVEYQGNAYKVTSVGAESFGIAGANASSSPSVLGDIYVTKFNAIILPDSITFINNYAFSNASSLTYLNLGNSLASIGDGVFYNCSSLQRISFPASVSEIGKGVFYGCRNLQEVVVDTNNTLIKTVGSFLMSYDEKELICVFGDPSEINVPESVEVIDPEVFKGQTGIRSLSFNGDKIQIQSSAFENCSMLVSVQINAMSPDSYIDNSAFKSCSKLEKVSFGKGDFGYIGAQSFSGCKKLSNFDMSSVSSLGKNTDKGNPVIGSKAFANTAIAEISVPPAMNALRKADAYGNPSRSSYKFISGYEGYWHDSQGPVDGAGVFGDAPFYGCSSLETITFKAGSDIGCFAYFLGNGCSITKNGQLAVNESFAFYNCSSLSSLVFESACPFFTCSYAMYNSENKYIFTNWDDVTSFDMPDVYLAVDYYITEGAASSDDAAGSQRLARVEFKDGTLVTDIAAGDINALSDKVAAGYDDLSLLDPTDVAKAQGLETGDGKWAWKLTGGQSLRESLDDSCKAYLVKANDLSAGRVSSPQTDETQIMAERMLSKYNGSYGEFDPYRYCTEVIYKSIIDNDASCWLSRYKSAADLSGITVFDSLGNEVTNTSLSLRKYDVVSKTLSDNELGSIKADGLYLASFSADGYEGSVSRWLLVKNHSGGVAEVYTKDVSGTSSYSAYAYGSNSSSFVGYESDYSVLVGDGDETSGLIAASLAGYGSTGFEVSKNATELTSGYISSLRGTVLAVGNQKSISQKLVEDIRNGKAANRALKVVRYGQSSSTGKSYSASELALRTYRAFKENCDDGDYGEFAESSSWGDTAVLVNPEEAFNMESISSYAYAKKAPVLFLEEDGSLGEDTLSYLKDFKNIVVAGNEDSVSEEIYETLESNASEGAAVSRIEAAYGDACGFSIAVAKKLLDEENATCTNVAVVDGRDALDAVAALNLSGRRGGLTLVTTSVADSKRVAKFLLEKSNDVDFVRIYGRDSSAISSSSFDLKDVLSKIWSEDVDHDKLMSIAEGDTFVINGAQYELASDDKLDMTGVFYSKGTGAKGKTITVDDKGYSIGTTYKNIAHAVITVPDQIYSSVALKPVPKVEYDGVSLKKDVDYVIDSYSDNTSAGAGHVTIAGKGECKGTVTADFNISKASLASAGISLAKTSYTYSGKACTPKVTVKLGSHILKEGSDYKVSYSSNKNAGAGKVTVNGMGSCEGSATASFKISKARQALKVKTAVKTVKKAKVAKKKQTVKAITKVAGAQGKLSYKKTGGSKNVTVNAKTGKVTVKKGTKKGTYKVKIKVSAKATSNFVAGAKTITIKVKVK